MIIKYRKSSNKHALFFLLFIFFNTVYMIFFHNGGNIWDEFSLFPIACSIAIMYCFWVYLFMYFKAKGYHWSVCLIATISGTVFPILIPLMYFFVPDRYPIEF